MVTAQRFPQSRPFDCEPTPSTHRSLVAVRRAHRDPPLRVRPPGPDLRSPAPHGRQPAAELSAARAGGLDAAARPAAVLEPVHLQRDPPHGRLQRRRVLPPRGPLRGAAGSGGVDRHRGRPLLRDRHRDVRLPAGTQALDGRLPARGRHLRVRGSGPESGQPRRHERGVRRHPVDAPGDPPHRARRALALEHRARDRLRNGDPRRSTRGDARRGAPRAGVRRHVGWAEPRALVASGEPMCDRCGTGAVPGGDPVVAGPRGDSQLATRVWRRRHRRELSDPLQHLRPRAVSRRRLRTSRGGPVLQPVQPARGRDLSRRAPAHRARDVAASTLAESPSVARSPDVVRRRRLRIPLGAGLSTHHSSTFSTASLSTGISDSRAAT